MDDLAEIVREIGRQQGENSFYRTCYGILKRLQDIISQAADDLLHIHQVSAYGSVGNVEQAYQIVEELKVLLEELSCREQRALIALRDFYAIENRAIEGFDTNRD
ncbi:hypothetical protein N7490_006293 [Penicillium lividum]|nr:hypothetical protein N7490_006293 [Penicillium lividum]